MKWNSVVTILLLMLTVLAPISCSNISKEQPSQSRASGPAIMSNRNPVSGIIIQPGSTISFSGTNVRHETSPQSKNSMLYVTGERGWSAYPESGRVVTNLPKSFRKSYPEQTRSIFSMLTTTNATRVGDELFRGLLCWHYKVKVIQQFAITEVSTVQTNQYLFLANPDFPLVVRRGSAGVWQTNMDVLEIKLDCPVSPDLFSCPTNLKPTRPFLVPAVALEIELRETRSSPHSGWASVVTNILSSDGITLTNHHIMVSHDANGKQNYHATTQTEAFRQGILACNYPMEPPYWGSVRKVGEDTLLGMKAEVFESSVVGRRYWVVDHPVLGAFSAKWSMGGGTPETNEVLRLEVHQ